MFKKIKKILTSEGINLNKVEYSEELFRKEWKSYWHDEHKTYDCKTCSARTWCPSHKEGDNISGNQDPKDSNGEGEKETQKD